MKMTIKALVEQEQQRLDKKFEERYPSGRYTIQTIDRNYQRHEMGIYWVTKRKTSHTSYKGIGVKCDNRKCGIQACDFQNNSWGRCTHYDSVEGMLEGAKRRNISEEVIKAFVERFQKGPDGGSARTREIWQKEMLHFKNDYNRSISNAC